MRDNSRGRRDPCEQQTVGRSFWQKKKKSANTGTTAASPVESLILILTNQIPDHEMTKISPWFKTNDSLRFEAHLLWFRTFVIGVQKKD